MFDLEFQEMSNPDFIFHNKLPKAGSSTMNNILLMLSQRNNFNYRKVEPHELAGDAFSREIPVVDYVKNITTTPMILLKHHLPFDFEKHGIQQPTAINVIRDPGNLSRSSYGTIYVP